MYRLPHLTLNLSSVTEFFLKGFYIDAQEMKLFGKKWRISYRDFGETPIWSFRVGDQFLMESNIRHQHRTNQRKSKTRPYLKWYKAYRLSDTTENLHHSK